jgi:cytochrome c peroxidase
MRTVIRLACAAALAALLWSLFPEAGAGKPDSRRELIELGRRLFLDPAVSRAGRFSCASCHLPEHGFSDPRRLSADENGTTRRHSQPLHDLVDGSGMHWDGEFDTVRELITARLAPLAAARDVARTSRQRHFDRARESGGKPDETEFRRTMATLAPPYYGDPNPRIPVRTPVEVRLADDGRYDLGFRRAFGTTRPRLERVIDALEAYVLSIRTTESRYDRYVAGDPSALTAQERRGLALFDGKANCSACHTSAAGDDGRARLTDGLYHNTGVTFANVTLDPNQPAKSDGGRGEMSFVAKELGQFKTPSLRDVAERAPYMHDGSLATLDAVVRYYDKGGTPNLHLDHDLQPLKLTEAEIADLTAFLRTLSGEQRAGLGPMAGHRPRNTTVRVFGVLGKPLAGLEIEVHPFGDRLEGARDRDRAPLRSTTDSTGRIRFAFPAWTHVVLRAKGYKIGLERPLPDYTITRKVTAVSRDQVLVRVTGPAGQARMPQRLTAWTPNTNPKKVVAVLKRARSVRGNEAVYVCDVPEQRGLLQVHLDFPAQKRRTGNRNRAVEIDFSGGESDPLILK